MIDVQSMLEHKKYREAAETAIAEHAGEILEAMLRPLGDVASVIAGIVDDEMREHAEEYQDGIAEGRRVNHAVDEARGRHE